jgi:hypothetical protein
MVWIAMSTVAITFVPKLYKLMSGQPSSNDGTPPRKESAQQQEQNDEEEAEMQNGTIYEDPPVPSVRKQTEKSVSGTSVASGTSGTSRTSAAKPPKRASDHDTSKSFFESSHRFYSQMSDKITSSEGE